MGRIAKNTSTEFELLVLTTLQYEFYIDTLSLWQMDDKTIQIIWVFGTTWILSWKLKKYFEFLVLQVQGHENGDFTDTLSY